MKRKFLYLLLTLCLLGQCLPAFAAQAPVLERIAFSGATIVGQFKSDVYQYQLVLDNAAVSPKLKSYKVQGEGNLFVTYDTDSTNHQTAVVVTLSYDTGSAKYTFTYKNAAAYVKNSENHLDSITCTLGELVPEMNEDDTTYKLYIPSDLTSLMITPVTKDINAYCAPVEMTLAPGQEIDLTLPPRTARCAPIPLRCAGWTRPWNRCVPRWHRRTTPPLWRALAFTSSPPSGWR